MSADFTVFSSGPIILVAHLEAKPGKADKVQKLLTAIHAVSNSEKEPGCLTFRTSRSGDKFVVFEKYEDQKAVAFHFTTEQFQALGGSIEDVLTGPPSLLYYQEFN